MTVSEFALVVAAIAAACTGVAAVLVAVRIGAVTRQIEPLIADMRATLQRVNAIAGDVEHVVHDARRLEGRLSTIVDGPLRATSALVQGLGAGLVALLAGRSRGSTPSPPRDGPGARGMNPQLRPTQTERGGS